MKTLQLYRTTTSRSLLLRLIAAHIFGTIFAYTVYIKLASLGDGYLPENFQGFHGEISSTILVHGIYSYIGAILPGMLTPMAFGIVVAIVIWDSFRGVYSLVNRKVFWICNLFPHFLIWSGVSSKEQIVIICGVVVIDFSVRKMFLIGVSYLRIGLVFVSLTIIFFIRPNYFIIYSAVFFVSISIHSLPKSFANRLSIGVLVIIFFAAVMVLSILLISNGDYVSEYIVAFMASVEASFLSYEANTNRLNIQWNDVNDFFINSIWSVPQGLIGPTLWEVILKPIMFPVFVEGILYLFVLFYLFFKLFIIAKVYRVLRFNILTYLWVSLAIIYVSHPYLMFNVGSSLRYKQSMHPVLFLFPLLVIAYTKAGEIANRRLKFSTPRDGL
jgi:hypothetical protein